MKDKRQKQKEKAKIKTTENQTFSTTYENVYITRKDGQYVQTSDKVYLLDREQAEVLYRRFGAALSALPNWSLYLLSSHTEFERCFGKPADKKRKLYNGMIKCDLFMYYKQ